METAYVLVKSEMAHEIDVMGDILKIDEVLKEKKYRSARISNMANYAPGFPSIKFAESLF